MHILCLPFSVLSRTGFSLEVLPPLVQMCGAVGKLLSLGVASPSSSYEDAKLSLHQIHVPRMCSQNTSHAGGSGEKGFTADLSPSLLLPTFPISVSGSSILLAAQAKHPGIALRPSSPHAHIQSQQTLWAPPTESILNLNSVPPRCPDPGPASILSLLDHHTASSLISLLPSRPLQSAPHTQPEGACEPLSQIRALLAQSPPPAASHSW